MAAQPPGPPRTAEIDLHDIIPSEVETHSALVPESSDRGEFIPVASTDNKVFQAYDSLRIGWSGWTNIVFATLTVLGGVLCTVRFFDSPELRRWAHAHECEYLYQRPLDVAAAREPGGDRIGAQTSSKAATGPKSAGSSGGSSAGSIAQGPQWPPGSPQFPNPPANSTGSEAGSRGRSSAGGGASTRNAISSRSSQARNVRSRIAHTGTKSPNRSVRTPMHASAKSDGRTLSTRNHMNQLAGARSLSAMNKAGGATVAAGRAMPTAMRPSGATVLRGSALNVAGLGREAAREAVRHERGAMNRR